MLPRHFWPQLEIRIKECVDTELLQAAAQIRMTNTQTPPTVMNTTGAPVTNTVANHAEKPEKFNGLAQFLKETAPQVEPPAEGQSSNAQVVLWKHGNIQTSCVTIMF
ncbi:hypothetical protein Tco_0328691 [Tanacetum coccineum]